MEYIPAFNLLIGFFALIAICLIGLVIKKDNKKNYKVENNELRERCLRQWDSMNPLPRETKVRILNEMGRNIRQELMNPNIGNIALDSKRSIPSLIGKGQPLTKNALVSK